MSLLSVIDTLKKDFGWTDDDIKKYDDHLQIFAYLKKDKILEKTNFYKATFSLSNDEFNKILKSFPVILGYSCKNVLEKVNFYKSNFSLSNNEFNKIFKSFPDILGLNNKNVLEKVDFYKSNFSLSNNEFNKIFKFFPTILSLNNKSVLEKADFYKSNFSLSNNEFNKIFKLFPAILGYSDKSVLEKVNFYKSNFSLSNNEFNKIFKSFPSILGYSDKSVLEKKESFDKIGLDSRYIVKNPSIFSVPAKGFIFKYRLLYVVFGNKNFLDKIWHITSEKKIWARYSHIKKEDNANPGDVFYSEKRFQKKYGIESIKLMEKYPITLETVEFVNTKHNELVEKNENKSLNAKLNTQEEERVKGE